MKTPIEQMLYQVEWAEIDIDPDLESPGLYATHAGVRRILISRPMSKMATRGQLGHDSTGRYFFLRGPQKPWRKHHIGALAANMPAKAWNSEPGHRGLPSSEDFIRAGGKIEVLPPAAYVAPAIQPVGWAA